MIGLNFEDIDTTYNTLRQLKLIYHSANEHSMRVPQPLNMPTHLCLLLRVVPNSGDRTTFGILAFLLRSLLTSFE